MAEPTAAAGHLGRALPALWQWGPVVGVACGPLCVAVLKFFRYPIDRDYFIGAVFIALAVWGAALVVSVSGIVAMLVQRRFRMAAIVTVTAVLAYAAVFRADLDLGYPHLYFRTHRAEFAQAAAFAASIPVDEDGNAAAGLPRPLRDLAGGRLDIRRSERGDRVTVLWMSYASGLGYGYAHAPSAEPGEVVLEHPARVQAIVHLGDGWWWVS